VKNAPLSGCTTDYYVSFLDHLVQILCSIYLTMNVLTFLITFMGNIDHIIEERYKQIAARKIKPFEL
jgi:hypothetical protein